MADTFISVISVVRGSDAAEAELSRAAGMIREALRKWQVSAAPEDVDLYLASEYGAHTARDVLKGTPVKNQLDNRKARFLRHFDQVRRNRRE